MAGGHGFMASFGESSGPAPRPHRSGFRLYRARLQFRIEKRPKSGQITSIKLRLATILSLLICACTWNVRAGVLISEFMALNSGGLTDQDGESSDWIEIRNDSGGATNLGGWHLTDDSGNLIKWTFPATNLPSGGYLIVFASGKNRAVSGTELHTNFKLSSDGGYL